MSEIYFNEDEIYFDKGTYDMYNVSESLYIYPFANGLLCITEVEKDFYENRPDFNKELLRKVSTPEDLQLCLNQLEEFKHSHTCVNSLPVNAKIKKILENAYISDNRGDITTIEYPNIQHTYSITRNDEELLNYLMTSYYYDGVYSYYIKWNRFFTQDSGHASLIKIETIQNVVTNIYFIDTSKSSQHVELDKFKYSILSMVIDFFTINGDLKLNFEINYKDIIIPINSFYNLNLQELEDILIKYGRCVAWTYYFIYNNSVLNKSIYDIYIKLASINSVERAILIMTWWDSISYRDVNENYLEESLWPDDN